MRVILPFFVLLVFHLSLNSQIVVNQGAAEDYHIVFHQNFEHHSTPIEYTTELWNPDWNYPGWRDGDHRWPSWYSDNIKDSIITDPETDSKVMKFNFKDTLVDGYSGVSPFRGGDYWKVRLGGEYKELYLSYNVKFRPGWEWNQGGKLPATNGGSPLDKVTQDECIRPGEGEGYSSAIMWKDYGGLAFYLFYQEQPNEQWGETILWNDYQPDGLDYDSEGRFVFNTIENSWYNITIRVVVNSFSGSVPNKDGIMEGFINGKLIESVTGLFLLTEEDINRGVNEIALGHFFGGNENYQGPLRDEWSYLDDFVCFTYADHMEVPRGNVPSPPGRVLVLPFSKGELPEVSDTEAPSIPNLLKATRVSGTVIGLAWEPSKDNTRVAGYRVFERGIEHSISHVNEAEIEDLVPNTTYSFSVSAFDPNQNESIQSEQLLVSTLDLDTIPPSTPDQLTLVESTQNSLIVSWYGSIDNENLVGYHIYLNGEKKGSTSDTVYSVVNLDPETSYTLSVSAFDASDNESPLSSTLLSWTTREDVLPPSIPENLMAALITANSISLIWDPSFDDVGVEGYHVKVNGIIKGNANSNSFLINGLYPGLNYDLSVAAYDLANNQSEYSTTLHVATKNPDGGVVSSLPKLQLSRFNAKRSANIVQVTTSMSNYAYTELLDYGVLLKKKAG